jgi:hypothetical protein
MSGSAYSVVDTSEQVVISISTLDLRFSPLKIDSTRYKDVLRIGYSCSPQRLKQRISSSSAVEVNILSHLHLHLAPHPTPAICRN